MSSTATIADLVKAHGFDVLDHLDTSLAVPVLDGLQVQGDLAIIPVPGRNVSGKAVPAEGIAVIAPVGAGHEHRLFAGTPGTAVFVPEMGSGQVIGTLQCTAPAYIAHPEHAYAGIAPGTYELRRQREQADEQRLIAD
jgi:hypothetical protein